MGIYKQKDYTATIEDRIRNFRAFKEGMPFSIADVDRQLRNTNITSIRAMLNTMVVNGTVRVRTSLDGTNIYTQSYTNLLRRTWVTEPSPLADGCTRCGT